MKRSYTVRFYTAHDLDLVSLIYQGYSMPELLRQSLNFFVDNKPCVFLLSDTTTERICDKQRVLEKKLTIDNEKVIMLLDKMNSGAWNNFFKNILRMYLCCPFPLAYVNEGLDSLLPFTDPFFAGKEVIKVYPRKTESGSKKRVSRKTPRVEKNSPVEQIPQAKAVSVETPQVEKTPQVEAISVETPQVKAGSQMVETPQVTEIPQAVNTQEISQVTSENTSIVGMSDDDASELNEMFLSLLP